MRERMNFLKYILGEAKKKNKKIVFPESAFSDRVIKAVLYLKKHKICEPILIGDASSIAVQCKQLSKFKILNPKTFSQTNEMANMLYELRKEKGMTVEQSFNLILDPFYFSTMLVKCGYADAMVGGAEVSTAQNLKPALQLLKNGGDNFVNSYTLFVGDNGLTDKVFVMADCGLNEEPDEDQLVKIANNVVSEYKNITKIEPKVAFLSYSTHGSAKGEVIEKMQNSFKKFKEQNPTVKCVGEVQLDSALIERVAKTKLKGDVDFYGGANVLIFPELNSANICYKAIFRKIPAYNKIYLGTQKYRITISTYLVSVNINQP